MSGRTEVLGWLLYHAEEFLPNAARGIEWFFSKNGAWLANAASKMPSEGWHLVLNGSGLVVAVTSPLWLYSWKRKSAISLAFAELILSALMIGVGLIGVLSYGWSLQSVIGIAGGGFVGVRGFETLQKAQQRPNAGA